MRVGAIDLSRFTPMPAVAEELRVTRSAVQVSSAEGDATGWFRRIDGLALSESQVLTRLTVPAGGARMGPPGRTARPTAGTEGALLEKVLELFGDRDALPDLSAMLPSLDVPDQAGADEVLQVLLLVLSYRARDVNGAPGSYRAAEMSAVGLTPGVLIDFSV